MSYSINYLAQVITEDPDTYLPEDLSGADWTDNWELLLEAPTAGYLNFFNKSTVPVEIHSADGNVISANPITGGSGNIQQILRRNFKQTPGPNGTTIWINPADNEPVQLLALRDLSTNDKLAIIELTKRIVEPELVRYEQYFVRQVAAGFLTLDKIVEDGPRLNKTIALFRKFSRKATWAGHKDLLKYTDWRQLELEVLEHEDKHIEYDTSGDTTILYTKTYLNNVMSLLLGGPPEASKYWLRVVTTPQAAQKYGKGTTWCTSSSSVYEPSVAQSYRCKCSYPDCNLVAYMEGERGQYLCYAHYYLAKGGGIYIVELQTPTKPRRPIFQISGNDMMNPEDVPISKFGPRFIDFIQHALEAAPGKLSPETVQNLELMLTGEPRELEEAY